MKYLFEDKAEDHLSRLFRYSLPDKTKRLLEYANGNGNLVNKAEQLLHAGEMVVVVLDTLPANKSIRDIYVALRRLSRQNDYRLIVWNILCAEYYFIKCFGQKKTLQAFACDNDLEIVTKVLPYRESILLQSPADRVFVKTFEKFCKLYIMKNGNDCTYPNNIFFDQDCVCDTTCDKERLIDKSDEYRHAYDFNLSEKTDTEDAWQIHNQLLQIVNAAIERYNQAGYLQIKAYPAIR